MGDKSKSTLPSSQSFLTARPSRNGLKTTLSLAIFVSAIFVSSILVLCPRNTSTNAEIRFENDPFHWTHCDLERDPRYLCGYLEVPLDYTNASDPRKVHLATTMFRADTHRKSNRTLVINPGGPGGSGTNYVWRKGEFYSTNLTNGQQDVLGWDPRGVNLTDPSISCFPRDAHRDRWSLATQQWPETGGYYSLKVADAMNEAMMQACQESYGDIPRFLSTAFVARDMDAIRAALGEDELTAMLVSYGTGIGQTYTQMFPDRVGRIAMDGMEYVVDGREPWGWGTASLDNVTNAWEDGFLGECLAAGPDRCALAPPAGSQSTLPALVARMDNLFAQILERPVPGFIAKSGPGIITYEIIISLLYSALYNAETWPKFARTLKELEGGNATLALEGLEGSWGFDPNPEERGDNSKFPLKFPVAQSEELTMMVICGDSYDAPQKPLEWWADLRQTMAVKSFISANSRLYNTLPCRHFPWKSAEVYRGGFNATLKNPVLLIGEPYDPATPLRSGRALAKDMGDNARLLVHHGYGHSSGRDTSKCTENILRALFVNGTLPAYKDGEESECYADGKPFPEGGEDRAVRLERVMW
ncbi:alpha/beta-hydrolase [Athelia psychrophila]|uniref:Alpha/beta-hydrolase n=1 Tax=Athelia psychrophila TaxID=1759441 RepID=A0A165Y3U3_9AGAM|nr:alpha/beta-hydrolase [Fibularhizoctonia sp. CBS 109695]